jgi:uncharacterized membrane protein YhdT
MSIATMQLSYGYKAAPSGEGKTTVLHQRGVTMGESRSLARWCFGIAFCVLTVLCWCPIGYGSYGEVSRIFGMPYWATLLLLFGDVLFVIELVYLFMTDFALYDDDLSVIMDELGKLERSKPGVREV